MGLSLLAASLAAALIVRAIGVRLAVLAIVLKVENPCL
jgi:hypothetical protein